MKLRNDEANVLHVFDSRRLCGGRVQFCKAIKEKYFVTEGNNLGSGVC